MSNQVQQATKFSVGQTIEWQSQSAGTWQKKRGTVLCILGARERLSDRLNALGHAPKPSHIKASDTALSPRYVVMVVTKPKAGKPKGPSSFAKALFYAPVVKVIDGESNGRGKLVKAAS